MNVENLKKLLKDFDPVNVNTFANYCNQLQVAKKQGEPKNPWMKYKNDESLAELFKKVDAEGLVFDGQHITLQSTGVSFDYVAYKNKMLLIYPETDFDIDLVYKGDIFSFKKESGKVIYSHVFSKPFEQLDGEIVGGYCVIKNKRGESLTTLSIADIQKHRKVAKTDFIWKQWFKEMCLKTVSKKACNKHCKDEFQNIENLDNENYDLEQPLGISIDIKSDIEEIKTIEKLSEYYHKNKDSAENKKDFAKAVTLKKAELEKVEADNGNN